MLRSAERVPASTGLLNNVYRSVGKCLQVLTLLNATLVHALLNNIFYPHLACPQDSLDLGKYFSFFLPEIQLVKPASGIFLLAPISLMRLK